MSAVNAGRFRIVFEFAQGTARVPRQRIASAASHMPSGGATK
jgi:hypothetical protein